MDPKGQRVDVEEEVEQELGRRGEIFASLDGLPFLHPGRASQHRGQSGAKSFPVPG